MSGAAWQAVVVSWNRRDESLRCLRALEQADQRPSIVWVDNGSSDGTSAAIRRGHAHVDLIETDRNLGFAGGANLGIRRALERGADWVVLVNNDLEVASDVFTAFRRAAAEHPEAGVLAGKVYERERPERLWYAGGNFSPLTVRSTVRGLRRRDRPRYGRVGPTARATGALMATSRAAIEAVGLLDEELFLYMEDVEWSLRARDAGFEVLFVPAARGWHAVSASSGGERRSTDNVYYVVRNALVVAERRRPLGRVGTAARRALVLAGFGTHVALRRRRQAALAATWAGFRDARKGRLGPRPG